MKQSTAVRMVIEGRVQGVGFRAWTERQARGLGLDGWVRNLFDGRVEALVAGPADTVSLMIDICRRGPAHARIDRVAVTESGPPPSPGFHILPSC